jgi:predicted nucleotidyltransferase
MAIPAEVRDTIRDVLQTEGADYVAVFGSYVRGEETSESDIDILVRFAEPTSLLDVTRIERELSDELGIQVDLVTEQSLSPYIADHVHSECEVLLA